MTMPFNKGAMFGNRTRKKPLKMLSSDAKPFGTMFLNLEKIEEDSFQSSIDSNIIEAYDTQYKYDNQVENSARKVLTPQNKHTDKCSDEGFSSRRHAQPSKANSKEDKTNFEAAVNSLKADTKENNLNNSRRSSSPHMRELGLQKKKTILEKI